MIRLVCAGRADRLAEAAKEAVRCYMQEGPTDVCICVKHELRPALNAYAAPVPAATEEEIERLAGALYEIYGESCGLAFTWIGVKAAAANNAGEYGAEEEAWRVVARALAAIGVRVEDDNEKGGVTNERA